MVQMNSRHCLPVGFCVLSVVNIICSAPVPFLSSIIIFSCGSFNLEVCLCCLQAQRTM